MNGERPKARLQSIKGLEPDNCIMESKQPLLLSGVARGAQ